MAGVPCAPVRTEGFIKEPEDGVDNPMANVPFPVVLGGRYSGSFVLFYFLDDFEAR